jgi:aminoglycoside phosphotransferase family enzyme
LPSKRTCRGFLTDAHAYKLKKPVRTAFVDLRSVDARRRNCAAELRLNRRLTSAFTCVASRCAI